MALEFEDKYNEFDRSSSGQKTPWLGPFLIKHNLAKDLRDADKKIIMAGVMILIVSAVLLAWSYAKSNTKEKLYNFPDELMSRFPVEIQSKILNVINDAKK